MAQALVVLLRHPLVLLQGVPQAVLMELLAVVYQLLRCQRLQGPLLVQQQPVLALLMYSLEVYLAVLQPVQVEMLQEVSLRSTLTHLQELLVVGLQYHQA